MENVIGFLLLIGIFAFFILALYSNVTRRQRRKKYRKRKKRLSVEERGELGENLVASTLSRVKGHEDYLINNYMFKGQTISVQIDHLLLTKYGLFVIETKNYSGTIYGREKEEEWTQVLHSGNVVQSIRNPVKQNASHVYELKRFLPSYLKIFSVIIFVQNNTQNIYAQNVINLQGFEAYYSRCDKSSPLTSRQMQEIKNLLLQRQCNGEITEQDHINEINKMISDIENNICPRCGGKLVLRVGKYGEFYGCSRYPACTFTKKSK